jgi:hypothetical protein
MTAAARCPCPARAAEDALLLLSTGRAAMALRVLEDLPAAIRLALADAYARGRREGRAEAPRPASRAVWRPSPSPRRLSGLRARHPVAG